MANMSDAFGEITIYAASVDVLIDLIQCHLKYEEGAYYSTSLDLFEDVSPENRTEIIKIVEENYELDSTTHDAMLVSDFTATGRWSFQSNIVMVQRIYTIHLRIVCTTSETMASPYLRRWG